MGNEASQVRGLRLEERPIEVSDLWEHYRAVAPDSGFSGLEGRGSLSVFKSDTSSALAPLQAYANNIMKYRHPNIVRYVGHWKDRSVQYLAMESVQPLSQVLSSQDSIQRCVGLHQIIQALDFLHSKGGQSHNNVNVGSIYVMPDGCWKLGGMEFLKPFSETNVSYLKQITRHRYDGAIDPDEEKSDDLSNVDQFAVGCLVEEIFKGRNNDDLPNLANFKLYCKKELQNPVSSLRPKFSTILQNEFFNHEFLSVHKFLISLPLKSEQEKSTFFQNLLETLRKFNEETVAKQLSGPLLSRLVLLNPAARDKLLPYLLIPKDNQPENQGLFSLNVFKHRITPQLLKMFRVRDIQVRLLLLKYFTGFMSTFSKEDLTVHILPELLLGIKDIDDSLVSMTLYCLADLVPLLGASTVIGAKRSKLFTDGRPMHSKTAIKYDKLNKKTVKPKAPAPDLFFEHSEIQNDLPKNTFGSRESIEIENNLYLPERPSPDGGEDLDDELLKKSSDIVNESDGEWSDWEQSENREADTDGIAPIDHDNLQMEVEPLQVSKLNKNQSNDFLQKAAIDAKSKKLTDISELDIKSQKYTNKKLSPGQKDEFDFFTDMEPVIEKASVLNIDTKVDSDLNFTLADKVISDKLNFKITEADQSSADQAWGDADWND